MSGSDEVGSCGRIISSLSLILLVSLAGCSSGEKGTRTAADVESDLVPELVEGGMLIAGGRPAEGIALLEGLLPRTSYPAPIHERIARARFDIGDAGSAALHIDSALSLGGPTVDRLLLRGRIRNARWDDSGAVADFDRVLELDSTNIEALYLSAYILARIEPDRAIGRYRRILELRPDDLNAMEELYTLLRTRKNFLEAIPIAERIYELDPRNASIGMELPLVLAVSGEADRAIEWFGRIAPLTTYPATEPTPLGFYTQNLILMYTTPSFRPDRSIERFARAVVGYIEEVSGDRTFPLELIVKGTIIAYHAGDRETGDSLAGRLTDRTHLDDRSRLEVARTAFAAGSPGVTVELLRRHPMTDNHPEPMTLLGKAYLAEGNVEDGERAFTAALEGADEDDPGSAGALSGLARIHAMRDDPSEAIRLFEQASGLDPTDPETVAPYAWYLIADGRHADRGYQLVREIVPEHQEDHDLLEAYGILAWMTGRKMLAESVLTSVDIESPLSPWGLSVWGDIYESLGQHPTALGLWKRGLAVLDAPGSGRGLRPELEPWRERLRTELLRKINSYGEQP